MGKCPNSLRILQELRQAERKRRRKRATACMMLLPRVLPGTKQASMDSIFFFQQNDIQRKVFMKFPYSWYLSDERNLDLSCLKFYMLLTAAWSSASCSPVPEEETTGTSSVLPQIKRGSPAFKELPMGLHIDKILYLFAKEKHPSASLST